MLSTESTVSTLTESTVTQVSTDVESTLSDVLEQPLPQLEQRAMIAKAKINKLDYIKLKSSGGGRMDWEFANGKCTLLSMQCVVNRNLLYNIGKSTQCSVINYLRMRMCIWYG